MNSVFTYYCSRFVIVIWCDNWTFTWRIRIWVWRCTTSICRKNLCRFLQGTVRKYKTRSDGLCISLFSQFSGGMFLPRIGKIGSHLTKLSQYKKGDVFYETVLW